MVALPEGFSEWEHLQSTLIRAYNQDVREEFSDALDDDGISTPRSSLKIACLVKDDDSSTMTLTRMLFYYMTVGRAAAMQPTIFGVKKEHYEEFVTYKPQVTMFFAQDADSVADGRRPSEAEISFRLVDDTSHTITEAKLKAVANRIKTEFCAGSGYRWSKGELLVTYKDLGHGLNLKFYVLNKSTAIELIKKVCDVTQQPYDEKLIISHSSERSFPNNPSNQTILGKSRKTPVRRPTVFVRFRYASCAIWGLPNCIHLVNRRWRNPAALVFWD
jgi:hypothetical protein